MKKIFNQFFIWKINKILRQAIKQKLTKMRIIVNAQMHSQFEKWTELLSLAKETFVA